MRNQHLGPELMISETAAIPLISASRLRSRWNVGLPAYLLACRRAGQAVRCFGRIHTFPIPDSQTSPYFEVCWRSISTMRRLFVVLLVAGLLMSGIAAVAADTPESAAATAGKSDPLVRALAAKGILTAEEANALTSLPVAQQRDMLTQVLLKKGVISAADLKSGAADSNERLIGFMGEASVKPAVLTTTEPAPAPAPLPKPPAFIAAVAPLRVLQTDPAKQGGLIPDLKLGSKVNLKIYGLLKASAIYDSSSPSGTDMPLPGFLSDTGPDGASEFHVKARFARIGANFEFPDISKNVTVTGKLEADFEGNFTRTLNRNISTVRSSQFSIRLAWGRIDYKVDEKNDLYALFGQDWTPFGSSTLPNLFETTGLGLGFGTLYERAPQFRFGVVHKVGGSRNLSISPEFALVMPAYGDNPTDISNQLGYGERQGADSGRPDLSGRVVTQFQLDTAPGVAPAQLIFSFVQGHRETEIPGSNVPTAFKAQFPNGFHNGTDRLGFTGEVQIPTRFVTVLAKYWTGTDLRWYFVGNLQSVYSDIPMTLPAGTTVTWVPTVDGSCSTTFSVAARSAMCVGLKTTNGVTTIVPQKPFDSQGGFVNLAFPLGRIFKANPESRNASWQLHLHYAYDELKASEIRRFGNLPNRNDLAAATLFYKLNNLVTFSYEQSMYRTRSVSGLGIPGFTAPLYRGIPARNWHDNRTEFGTIFSF